MTQTLQKRIQTLVKQVLEIEPGAWLVWCDPKGDWAELLKKAATDFKLLSVEETTAGESGSPKSRREIQALLEAGQSFVLHVPASPDKLGWVWAQALLAEKIYATSLREQLREWGWRPANLAITDQEIAVQARQRIGEDPAQWGTGGLQPSMDLLQELIGRGTLPKQDYRLILDFTIEQAGLPALDEKNLELWRNRAMARLLVTQAYEVATDLVGSNNEWLVAPANRKFVLEVLSDWQDRISRRDDLLKIIPEADPLAGLRSLSGKTEPRYGPFLSQAAESAVFANSCLALSQKSGRELLESFAATRQDFERHAEGFWGRKSPRSEAALPWGELVRLSEAAQVLLNTAPVGGWSTPTHALKWYTETGWEVDRAGEEILRNLEKTTPELLALITPLRAAYRARWEGYLMDWSEIWTAAGCPIPTYNTAGKWLKELLKDKRATAIIVADAMRYAVGASLVERINQQEGVERAKIKPARTALPTMTALGMGMALPIEEEELVADLINGKWQLHLKDKALNLSLAEQRREWWRTHGKVAPEALLNIGAVLSGQIPKPQGSRTRLVIFDDLIDKLGHDEELEGLGSEMVLKRYSQAIQRLRDQQWLRILVMTDHGFIQWSGSEEKNVAPPLPNAAYSSRRAMAYPANTKLEGPQGVAPGGKWKMAFTSGAASFRAYGGLGFFHGGASLQEWIIPCVLIEWPQKAEPVKVEIVPIPQILGARVKITLKIVRQNLFGEEALSREVALVIRDAQSRIRLFESERQTITPIQEEVTFTLKALDEAKAERGTPLLIEVYDTRSEEVIDTATSILMKSLEGW
ncbi:MAG: PglZ domain-containing protein [Chloroflexi bacterium]|nr:PglZ domain-containing protein [Chloroflexota bacterium]